MFMSLCNTGAIQLHLPASRPLDLETLKAQSAITLFPPTSLRTTKHLIHTQKKTFQPLGNRTSVDTNHETGTSNNTAAIERESETASLSFPSLFSSFLLIPRRRDSVLGPLSTPHKPYGRTGALSPHCRCNPPRPQPEHDGGPRPRRSSGQASPAASAGHQR